MMTKMIIVEEVKGFNNINRACASLSGAGIRYQVTTKRPNVIRYWFTDYDGFEKAGEIEFPIK